MRSDVLIPAHILADLRRERGLVSYPARHCFLCSRSFRAAGEHIHICQHCLDAARAQEMEISK